MIDQWLALVMVVTAVLGVLLTMRGLRDAVDSGRRTRRLRLRRFLRAGGWFELTVAAYMVIGNQWVFVPALAGLGLGMLGMSRMWGKYPWMMG